jgi:hypothetical protein
MGRRASRVAWLLEANLLRVGNGCDGWKIDNKLQSERLAYCKQLPGLRSALGLDRQLMAPNFMTEQCLNSWLIPRGFGCRYVEVSISIP